MEAYCLAPHLRYRREAFGSLVCDRKSKRVRRFNRSAAMVLEHYIRARNDLPLSSLLDPHVISSFVDQCKRDDLIVNASRGCISRDQIFHIDTTSFRPNMLHAPLGLEIELTRRCLRSCSYCAYESHPGFSTAGELSKDQWKSLVHSSAQAGVFIIRFTGGDPLLKPDAFDIFDAASQCGLLITIGSDLTYFDESSAERLAALDGLVFIQTTLDGPSKEIADAFRGNGNYLKVLRGARLLRKYSVPFVVGMVITKANFRHVAKTAALAQEIGADRFLISPLYIAGRSHRMAALAPSEEEMRCAWDQYADSGITFGSVVELLDDPVRLSLGKYVQPADSYVRIDPFGNIYPSIKIAGPDGRAALAGNVQKSHVLDIWRGSHLLDTLRRSRAEDTSFGRMVELSSVTS